MSVTIAIGRDEASGEVARIHGLLASGDQRRALMKNLGVRAEQGLKRYWEKRDAENPNKMGWPRQHFWSRIAKRTAFDPSKTTENTATVVVADPALAAKIHGATVKAIGAVSPATGKPTKFLAIPMEAAAYGNWPRSGIVPGLFFVGSRIGNGGYLAARQGGRLVFFYRLLPAVKIPMDPQALPPAADLGADLAETALSWFRRQEGGGAN